MSKNVRVVSVGPALSVQGGISRVIAMIKGHLPNQIRFRHVATFTRYTGAGDNSTDRGSKVVQGLVFLWAFTQIMVLAFSRRTVFHVHFSTKRKRSA